MIKKLIFLLFVSFTFSACTFDKVEPLTLGCDRTISYTADILPIVTANCVVCHNASTPNRNYLTYEGLKQKADNGTLFNRIVVLKDMPAAGSISDKERNMIKCWIDQGAPNN